MMRSAYAEKAASSRRTPRRPSDAPCTEIEGNTKGKLLLDNISGIAREAVKLLVLIITGIVLLNRMKNSTWKSASTH
jgi:hypothetical protein